MGPPRKTDRRLPGLLLTLALVLGGGLWIARGPTAHAPQTQAPVDEPAMTLEQQFHEAVLRLHAKRYAEAVEAWQRVLVQAPALPEAHVNLGFAWLGLGEVAQARRAFDTAIELRPQQANAYYGLALSHEAAHDLASALGAMRSYLHLARDEDPAHLARARAALWEWEARIDRQRGPSAR